MGACKKYRDIILSDLIDGELDRDAQAGVQEHLAACPACQAFAAEVSRDAVLPFTHAGSEVVPAHIWASIKERIEPAHAESPLAEFLRGLAGFFAFPKLVPALMGVVMLVLVGSSVLQDQELKQARAQAQGEYLVAVLASAGNITADADNADTETPLETYFL